MPSHHWQPLNPSVATVALPPAVTVNAALAAVWLVCKSEGVQSS